MKLIDLTNHDYTKPLEVGKFYWRLYVGRRWEMATPWAWCAYFASKRLTGEEVEQGAASYRFFIRFRIPIWYDKYDRCIRIMFPTP